MDGERAPVFSAQLEQGDRLVDPAHPTVALPAELHHDIWRGARSAHDLARSNEIRVGIETLLELLDRKFECGWIDALTSSGGHAVGVSVVVGGSRSNRVVSGDAARADAHPLLSIIASGFRARLSCSRVSRPRAMTTS